MAPETTSIPKVKLSTPKVSIGMPVYNGAMFIRDALDSLIAQTFADYELIISDNASTDETESICQEYAARDSRIRYVRHKENHGPTANFHFVLEQAIGEYFMWAAADDRWHNEYLHLTSDILDVEPYVGLVFTGMEVKNLVTHASYKNVSGFTSSRRKIFRLLFRIHENCPNLIYGLHRLSILKRFKIESFDYFDIHLTHWYELNSSIRILPQTLFISGSNGVRVPYSITGLKISHLGYLKSSWRLLREHFPLSISTILIIIMWHLISKNTKLHNLKIGEANSINKYSDKN